MTRDSYGYINHADPQTLNLYTYAGNNPVNNVDPTGCFMEGDENLPPSIYNDIINIWNPIYEVAEAIGDTWTMGYAHQQAEALRAIADIGKGCNSREDKAGYSDKMRQKHMHVYGPNGEHWAQNEDGSPHDA